MKKLKLPQSLLATLAVPAVLTLVVPAGNAIAQGQTETKIRLMADALRARDSGDLDAAKKNLEELLVIAPNDATVQRLLAGVDASIAARASGTAVAETSSGSAVSEPVEISYPPKAATSGQSSSSEAESLSQPDALAKQENERIEGLIADARAKRGEARSLAKQGRFDEAAISLDTAINSLPSNPATAGVISDLQAEKNGLLLEKAQSALSQGDTEGARKALDAYAQASSDTKKSERLDAKIDSVEINPPLQPIEVANPRFIKDQKEAAKYAVKGRSQYLAGDLEGAQETFRYLESIDGGNPEAKSFLTRIANEKAKVSELNRPKTRAQLIQEVSDAWNRPGIYLDKVDNVTDRVVATPLAQKLNSILIPDVNFTGVELSRVISTLSAVSEEYDKSEGVKGVNIVLQDQASKNPAITITLRNLSLKRILDLITENNGYTYEVTEDTVVVRQSIGETGTGLDNAFFPVTRATVTRMTGIGAAAATPAASADPFAAPSAAPASSGGGESGALQAFLEQAGVKFSTTPGSSLVYDGAAIIVTQTPRNIERIRNILNRYNDVRQVEIEAKFMDVQEGVLEELGVNWTAGKTNGSTTMSYTSSNRTVAGALGGGTTGSVGSIQSLQFTDNNGNGIFDIGDGVVRSNTPIDNAPPSIPGAPNLGIGAPALGAITGIIDGWNVSATIRALSQKSGTDLLSAPKVTVLSGNPANIVIAQELRYPQSYGEIQSEVGSGGDGGGAAGVTITAGTPLEFTMRNVGVELKVTPTVEEDDYSISLDLNPKVTEFEGFVEYGGQSVAISGGTTVTVPSGFYQPIFSTREVTTKVMVWDGATLVMGGLTREEVKKVNDKVPVLGDIPLIGRAFRSSGETTSKRNLLIFVTANLITPGGSPKKQQLKYTQPASIFQNPTVVTPAAAEARARR
jgi:general secretion pathway protein D